MKKNLALLLVTLFLFSMFPFYPAAATVESGTCGAEGDNLTWTLDDTGTLTISGVGDMQDFSANIYSKEVAPWLIYSDDIKSVVVLDGVTGIGDNAFYRCENISEVNVPDTLTRIGSTKLIDTLWYQAQPEGVVYFGKYAYGYRGEYPRDGAITLKDGTLGIADGAFSAQSRLHKIVMPDTVTFIGASAFSSCQYLEEINLSSQLKTIGDYAFSNNYALLELNFPDSLLSIGNYAFYHCKFPEIILPENLRAIGAYAFYGCQFQEIVIPNSVASIGSFAFALCGSLKKATISNSVETLGEKVFFCCGSLNELQLGKIVETATFSDISYLTKVTILPGVETVGEAAFANERYLSEVVFPTSLKKIDTNAFLYCENLNDVYYYGAQEEWKTVAVGEGNAAISKYATIHYEYHEHVAGEEKQENTVPPTCTETGSFDTVRYCTICGAELARDTASLDPLGHDLSHTAFKAATCTENGNAEYYTCARCNLMFSDEGAENQIINVVIPAAGHNPVADAAVVATCTKDGKTEGSHCSVCGEVLKAQTVVQAAGHKWDDGKVTTEPTQTKEGVKTFTCTVCKATREESVEKLPEPEKPAYLPGDVDNDGSVTAGDARLALRGAVGLETYEAGSAEFNAADVDKSGDLTAGDARLILRAAVGLEELK